MARKKSKDAFIADSEETEKENTQQSQSKNEKMVEDSETEKENKTPPDSKKEKPKRKAPAKKLATKKRTKSESSEEDQDSSTQKKQKSTKTTTTRKSVSGKKGIEEIENIISTFLLSKSRPYPLSEIVTTFKLEGTKPDVTKATYNLVDKGVLMKKEFGKTIAFLGMKQLSNMPEEEIEQLKSENQVLLAKINEVREKMKELNDKLKILCEYPADEDLVILIKKREYEIEQNKKRCLDLSDGKIKIDKADMVKIDKEVLKCKKILRERNIIFKNIFDVLHENSGMSKKDFKEEIGLEEEEE